MEKREVLHQAGPTEGMVSSWWWQRGDGFFAQAEALVILSTILFAIQVVFGWWRRSSSNVFIKYTLWLAYTLTPTVAIYTLGLIGSFVYAGNNLKALPEDDVCTFFLWSLALVTALGRTYSMTAYDVDENKQYARHLTQHAHYVLKIAAVIKLVMALMGLKSTLGWITASFCLLYWPPSILMTSASMMASSSRDRGSLYLQDYMKKSESPPGDYDPTTLQGYNYIIFIMKLGSPNPVEITVSQVATSNAARTNTEVCLSYALFRLLRRRFFGAACPEATLDQTRALVFQGLLLNEDHNFAYRIIEAELGFAYDHFFTTSTPYLGFMIIVSGIGKAAIYLLSLALPSLNLASRGKAAVSKDRDIATVVIMLVLLAMELLQLYAYLSSDFAKVVVATLPHIPIPMKCLCFHILRLCSKLPQPFGRWQNKIGQHSLLKDLHERSITSDLRGSLSWIVFDKLLHCPSAFPRGISYPGVKDPDRVPLTDEVKKAITKALRLRDGHLSNGTVSLQSNELAHLSEEFLMGSHASDLLIWHIATEYCDIIEQSNLPSNHEESSHSQDDFASNRQVAATLSSYCAYLMAFAPELLLDHHLETTSTFHRTREVALKYLKGKNTPGEKYQELKDMNHSEPPQQHENMNESSVVIQMPPTQSDVEPNQQNDNTNDGQPTSQYKEIFRKGVQLGKRMDADINRQLRWKILAEFWTEMILYIAPSNNARDHIQHLANGGEFLTHLWALLTHAGILERGQMNAVNVQNAGANQAHQDQEQEQGLQPGQQAHAEDTQNPVNHQEIGEEELIHQPAILLGNQEADIEAQVHSNSDFPTKERSLVRCGLCT